MTKPLEEVLDDIYRVRYNMCVAAEKAGVSLEEMKRLFRVYMSQRAMPVDGWRGDVEMCWPWV
jgi:hypothetical protein|tara:strand:+ start:178 stop:366 length:189 start_codon:yes stop_codon:yes gene_type:complete